jgi:hypothetical protein
MILGVVALVTAGVAVPVTPAGAVDALDVRGRIEVYPDYGACGFVRFQTVQTVITGNFSGAGLAGNSGAPLSTVRGSVPILAFNTDFVQVCIPGSGIGSPQSGLGSYILTASGNSGDTSTVKNCITYTPGGVPFTCYHL